MGFGKAKIAADSTCLPHSNIGDILLQFDQRRQFLLQHRGCFHLAVSAQRANPNRAIIDHDVA